MKTSFKIVLFWVLALSMSVLTLNGCASIKQAWNDYKACKADTAAGGCNEIAAGKTKVVTDKVEAKVEALVTPLATTAVAGVPVPGAGIAAPIAGEVAGKVSGNLAALATAPFIFFWFAMHERRKEVAALPVAANTTA